ncbi:MAG TPA: serine hydrolase domain-containing protein [Candidatus Acidoferrum sp.]|nr:serine hydrolase domain-containing protein [Candidatus Acidoferrum sp.]
MHFRSFALRSVPACIAGLALFACAASIALPAPIAQAVAIPAAHQSSSALSSALGRVLSAYLDKYGASEHLSALSLAVSLRPGTTPIDVAVGTTEYGSGAKAGASDLYQIGSNTKAFTAVAVLQLEAQGRLSIDAPIGGYLPQYPKYAKLTLRRLLNMTSGLPTYDDTPAWFKLFTSDPMRYEPPDKLIRLVYPQFKYTPGTKYSYSNTGYILAQQIVAARSQSHSFAKEIARIIASAGLKNTYYSDNFYPPDVARRVVAGYYEFGDPGFEKFMGKNVTPYTVSWAQGAGSIVSTPEDMTVWARALYQGTALLPDRQKRELMSLISLKTAQPLAVPTASDPAGFGLGVAQRYDENWGAFWFYLGETLGFRAAHLYFPKSGLTFAIFANSRPPDKDSHLPQLFKQVYETIQNHRIR